MIAKLNPGRERAEPPRPENRAVASESPTEIAELADQVQHLAGNLELGDNAYELIRVSSNIVFENPEDQIVARVASNHIRTWGIAARLAECRQLARLGAPFLPPLRDEVFRLPAGGRVTFWQLAEYDVDLDSHDLAVLAAGSHRVQTSLPLNEWRPQMRRPGLLASLAAGGREGLPAAIGDRLRNLYDQRFGELVSLWQELDPPTTLIHGDFNASNVVRLDGRLLMCDPDNLCRGPVEVDLAKIRASCQQLGSDCWDKLLADYPLDYNPELLDKIVRVEEVQSVMWSTAFWRSRPAVQAEIQRHLDELDQPAANPVQSRTRTHPNGETDPGEPLARTQADWNCLVAELIESIRRLRTDRTHPNFVDGLPVAIDGRQLPLDQLAVIQVTTPQTLAIHPFRPANRAAIVAAIRTNQQPGWELDDDGRTIKLLTTPTDDQRQRLVDQLVVRHKTQLDQLHHQHDSRRASLTTTQQARLDQLYRDTRQQMQRIVERRRQEIIQSTEPAPSPTMARQAIESAQPDDHST